MRTSSLVSALVLAAGLIGGGVAVGPALAQSVKTAAAAEARQAMSIPQVYEKLTALGYWNIDKIERDPSAFEVRANGANGDRLKLYVDARTGEIINSRLDGRRRGTDASGRGSAECSERRCRDDLPQTGVAVPPAVK